MKTLITASLLLACLSVPLCATAADGVEVRIGLLRAGKIDLAYQIPPGCTILPLRTGPWTLKQQRAWRNEWQAMDDCSAISDAGIAPRNASCRVMRFTVTSSQQERQYSPVTPVGDEGLYLHTDSFAPEDSCGPVTWNFSAPNGAVVVDGQSRGAQFVMSEANTPGMRSAAIYLGRQPLENSSTAITVFTPEIPNWLKNGLTEASAGIVLNYRQSFPQLALPLPALFVSNVSDIDGPRFQADVSQPRMLNFTYFNASSERDVKQLQVARSTVAHEYAHILQSGMRSQDFLQPERTMLNEGGAEFIRWISEYRLGWKTGAVLGEELDSALNLCLMETGDLPWQRVMNRNAGITPYNCGLAIHVLTLAARKLTSEKGETVLGNYYAAVRRDPSANFAKAIECNNIESCQPTILPSLLGAKVGFASQINSLVRSLGVVRKGDVKPTPKAMTLFANAAFAQLMTEDCNVLGYWNRGTYFEVDRVDSCNSLQTGMKIVRAEGFSLFDDPQQAAQAIAEACDRSGSTTLVTTDGKMVPVACRNPYRPSKNFYMLDTGKILTLLEGKSAKN